MNDLISRQAAIDLIDEFEEGIENGDRSAYTRTREKMCELPSAEPEQRKGRWIPGREIAREYLSNEQVNIEYENYNCSECGFTVKYIKWDVNGELVDRYCSFCGADMRGEHDE